MPYEKSFHRYTLWQPFMGFNTAAEKEAFIAAFPKAVKNAEPFKTELISIGEYR